MEENLAQHFEDYKNNVQDILHQLAQYKTANETSKLKLLSTISEAGKEATKLLQTLTEELVSDVNAMFDNQLAEYKQNEERIAVNLNSITDLVDSALNDPKKIKEASRKLDKIRFSLEKPVYKEISFIEQWPEFTKADIGLLFCDTVKKSFVSSNDAVPPSSKVPMKTVKLSTPRLPTSASVKSLNLQTGTNSIASFSTPAASPQLPDSKPRSSYITRDAVERENNSSTCISEKNSHCDSLSSMPADERALIISAINEWNCVDGVVCKKEPEVENIGSHSNENEFNGRNSGDDEYGYSEACSEDTRNESVTDRDAAADSIPTFAVNFAQLSLNSKPTANGESTAAKIEAYTKPEMHIEDDWNVAIPLALTPHVYQPPTSAFPMVKTELSSPCEPSAISCFLKKGAPAGVLKAYLTASLGGKILGFRFPIGVCTYNNGLIVCNSGDNSVVYFRYADDGSVSDKHILQGRFKRPSAVVVDREGFLFVKDDICIKKFDKNLNEVPMKADTGLVRPYGLALTKDNLLVTMCDCGVGRGVPKAPSLRIYKTTGELVGYTFLTFPFSEKTKLRFMDIYGDTIFISDLGASFLYCCNVHTGEERKTLAAPGRQPGQFNEPSGITCDRDGNMIVGDSRSNRLQIYDKNGKYRALLDCQDGLVRPSGIYLSDDDKLYAVNYITHKINVYTLDRN